MKRKPRDLSIKGRIGAYLVLSVFTLFAIFPILRVISISLRPGNRLLSRSLSIIPDNASLQSYIRLLTEEPFLLWLLNSWR